MDYLIISSSERIEYSDYPDFLQIAWDQMPVRIAQFCDAIGPELVSLGITSTDAKWESICEKCGSHIVPKKRIAVLDNIDFNWRGVVSDLLRTLRKTKNLYGDLFSDASEKIHVAALRDSARQIREIIGGRSFESAILVCMGDESLEIKGKIPKNSSITPDVTEGVQRILGYVDAPSVWNKCVMVKSEDQRHSGRYFVDVARRLETLHQAQRDQAICEIYYENRIGANNQIERIVTELRIVADEQQRLLFVG